MGHDWRGVERAGADRACKALSSRFRKHDPIPSVRTGASPLRTGAQDEAKARKDEYVSLEHLLLAGSGSDTAVQALFRRSGLTQEKLVETLTAARGASRATAANAARPGDRRPAPAGQRRPTSPARPARPPRRPPLQPLSATPGTPIGFNRHFQDSR
jgi:ATP-dependent Clp protease ATP-binding subunit ClpA